MLLLTNLKNITETTRTYIQYNIVSPIMEEGLLIGIAIVAILIVLGIIFGLFDWIAEAFASLFDRF